MKKIILILSGLLILLGFACDRPREVTQYSIEQFYQNLNIFGGAFSPDESKLLVTSNETGIYNVFALPVDGGNPIQLTDSDEESFFAQAFFPEDDRVLFQADRGGNENDHIYLLEDGNVTDITPFKDRKSQFFGWTRDNKSALYLSNKRNPRFFDLYEAPVKSIRNSRTHRMLYRNDEGYDIGAISKDKRYLALVRNITTNNNELYLYDRETGEATHISPHQGDATYSPQFFDLAGKHLYFLADENSEFDFLARYVLETGEIESIFETDWDVWYAYDSYNETYRVIGVNQDAKTTIHMIALETGTPVSLPEIENAGISSVSISRSEKRMRLTAGTSTMPSNIYVYDFDDGTLTKLTNTLNPEIDPADLVEGKVVRYPSFDDLEIPAVYYEPQDASRSNKVPGLIWVHGGPGGQTRLGYRALLQFLVNHGYAVLGVNNRGSSGYGKTFFMMDDRKHGDVDLKDCVYGKKYLTSTGVVDPERIGIIGGSYGGYMVMAALAYTPEEFAVGVNIFGVTNWLRTLKSIPPYWESFREALYSEMGDPFSQDSLRLYQQSPLFHAHNVVKPLMVLQGANDPRVLQAESDEMVAAVRENEVPVEYVLFPDEGHGFVKKENEIKGYGQILTFLDTYLKKQPE